MKKLAVSLTKTYRKHFEHPVVSVLRLQGTITAQRGDDSYSGPGADLT